MNMSSSTFEAVRYVNERIREELAKPEDLQRENYLNHLRSESSIYSRILEEERQRERELSQKLEEEYRKSVGDRNGELIELYKTQLQRLSSSGGGLPNSQPSTPSQGCEDAYTRTAMSSPEHGTSSLATQARPSSHIDPRQVPRPQQCPATVVFQTRVNGSANVQPPAATSTFVSKDTGNCSPRFMRCTLNQVPGSAEVLGSSSMPLALIVQPLALQDPAEEPIQVAQLRKSGPVRCASCRGYVNCFTKFVDQGHSFICNLCNFVNETPSDYVCSLGPDGRRLDADRRPELCKGTLEYAAPNEYVVDPPLPPATFFLIDVSLQAVNTGATAAACAAIHKVLRELPKSSPTLVGIATFDSTVHYYNLNVGTTKPTMRGIPDARSFDASSPMDAVVPFSEAKEDIEQLLCSIIPTMFLGTRVVDSALGDAVQGASFALKETGGKICVFQAAKPGKCHLQQLGVHQETYSISGAFRRASEYVLSSIKLGSVTASGSRSRVTDYAKVAVDLFLMTRMDVDLESLQAIPRTSGGQLYYYHLFNAATDAMKLYNDLRWNLTRPQGIDAVMQVRCSKGLTVDNFYGSFHKRVSAAISLPSIDCDRAIAVTFKHTGKFQEGAEVCFQCAVILTTMTGESRIRVHTLSLPCTTMLQNVFSGADLYAQFAYLLKHVSSTARDLSARKLSPVKDKALEHCHNIMHAYRKSCSVQALPTQLIMPVTMALLPLYTLALSKAVDFRMGATRDEMTYWLARALSVSASSSVPFVYPRMFTIHDLPTKEELRGSVLPPPVDLSKEKLPQNAICLLEDGEDAYIWLRRATSPEIISQLFDVPSIADVVTGQVVLPVLNNPLSRRLNNLLDEIRRQRSSYLRLRVIKEGDPMESFLFVEDKMLQMSYTSFLVHLHKKVQQMLGRGGGWS